MVRLGSFFNILLHAPEFQGLTPDFRALDFGNINYVYRTQEDAEATAVSLSAASNDLNYHY